MSALTMGVFHITLVIYEALLDVLEMICSLPQLGSYEAAMNDLLWVWPIALEVRAVWIYWGHYLND